MSYLGSMFLGFDRNRPYCVCLSVCLSVCPLGWVAGGPVPTHPKRKPSGFFIILRPARDLPAATNPPRPTRCDPSTATRPLRDPCCDPPSATHPLPPTRCESLEAASSLVSAKARC